MNIKGSHKLNHLYFVEFFTIKYFTYSHTRLIIPPLYYIFITQSILGIYV